MRPSIHSGKIHEVLGATAQSNHLFVEHIILGIVKCVT
jgi:hypothetical protein